MVLTEMRSTIEYYVGMRYTGRIWVGVDFGEKSWVRDFG